MNARPKSMRHRRNGDADGSTSPCSYVSVNNNIASEESERGDYAEQGKQLSTGNFQHIRQHSGVARTWVEEEAFGATGEADEEEEEEEEDEEEEEEPEEEESGSG